MSRIEAQGPQGNIQEGQRLMIIELERYNEIGIYREWYHRVAGTCKLSGWRLEGICNYGSCLNGGEGVRDANRAQVTYNQPPSWE